jgi:hypothetical protein
MIDAERNLVLARTAAAVSIVHHFRIQNSDNPIFKKKTKKNIKNISLFIKILKCKADKIVHQRKHVVLCFQSTAHCHLE